MKNVNNVALSHLLVNVIHLLNLINGMSPSLNFTPMQKIKCAISKDYQSTTIAGKLPTLLPWTKDTSLPFVILINMKINL